MRINNGRCRIGIVGKQFIAGPVGVAGAEGCVRVATLADGLPTLFPDNRLLAAALFDRLCHNSPIA